MRIVKGRGRNRVSYEVPHGSVVKKCDAVEVKTFVDSVVSIMKNSGIKFAC